MNEPSNSPARVGGQRRLPPVRVKVFRPDGKIARVHPPDGESAIWWGRLKKALGTTSSDFVNASLFQIQSASRSPWGGISELSMNAALAMIEAAAPKDEIEAALAVQMAQPPWQGTSLDPTARKLTREAIATVSAQNSRGVAESTQLLL